MAYTTIDQFKKNTSGKLVLSQGNLKPNTLFYEADMAKVSAQENCESLMNYNVVFERYDDTNGGVHHITVKVGVLAGGTPMLKPDNRAALPWPPYYHEDDDDYAPGSYLTNGEP